MSSPSTPSNPGPLNWMLVCILGVVWGSAFMSMSVALRDFSPLTVAALRVGFGAIFIVAIGRFIGQPLGEVSRTAGKRGWFFTIIIGLITVILPFLLLTWGLQHVPSAFAGITMGSLPVLILPLAYIFTPDEGIGPRRVAGVIVGFCGLLVLFGPGLIGTTLSAEARLGQFACMGAAMCYAVGSVVTRRAPKMPPVAFAAGTLVVGAICLVPVALYLEGIPQLTNGPSTWAVLYLAALPTGLAAVLRLQVITTAGSVFMSLTNFMVPLWSIVFGVVFLSEQLPGQIYGAFALILLGIAIAQSRGLGAFFRSS